MKKIILLFSLLIFSFTILFSANVYVVKSSSIALYEEAIEGFKETMAMSGMKIGVEVFDMLGDDATANEIIETLKNKDDISAIYTLGARASDMVAAAFKDVPVVFSYVLNWKSYKNLNNDNVTGVEFEIPPNVSLALFGMIVPTAKKIGIIYDEKNSSEIVAAIESEAANAGFEIVKENVRRPRDVKGRRGAMNSLLHQNIEALWMIADPTVLTRDNLVFLIQETKKNKIPTLTVQSFFVQYGALFAVAPDYKTIGSQAFNIVQNIINGQAPKDINPETPMGSINVINNATAQEINVTFGDFLMRMFNEVYE
jgi:putative tryptophan/tyrosine transport system substrate-binding protein